MKNRKQIVKIILVFVISLFSLLLTSCSEDDTPVAPSNTNVIMTSTPVGDVAIGAKAMFVFEKEDGGNFIESSQRVSCTFDIEKTKVWINEQIVKSGESVSLSLNSQSLRIEAEPLVTGNIPLTMNIVDGNQKKSKILSFNTVTKVYNVQLHNVRTMYAGHRKSLDIHFIDPSRDPSLNPAVNVDHIVSAKVIQGKGMIEFPAGVVWCDTIPNFEPMEVKVPNQEYKFLYTGFEIGEHHLEITVTDKEGYTSTDVVTIVIVPSIFKVTATEQSDATIERNESFDIHIGIDRLENYGNKFYAGFRTIKGKLRVSAGARSFPEITDGVVPSVENLTETILSNVYYFTPETEGDIEAVLEIHDQYGTMHEVPVKFFVTGDGYNVIFDAEEAQDAFTTQNFSMAISGSTDEFNEYQMSVSMESGDINAVNLEMNNLGSGFVDVMEKGFLEIGESPSFNIKFTAAGVFKLKFELKDKHSDPKEQFLTFTVVNNPLTVDIGTEQTVFLGTSVASASWKATLSLPTGESGSSDIWQHSLINYTLLQGHGQLEVNTGSGLAASSATTVLNGNECHFRYTPDAIGIHILSFVFTLDDGRTITRTKIINVTYSPIDMFFSCLSNALYEGQTRAISVRGTQDGYEGDLTYKYEFLSGAGGISTGDGSILSAGTNYILPKNAAKELTFTPTSIGAVKIKFTVTGGDDITATSEASFQVEKSLSIVLTSPTNVMMGANSTFPLTITNINSSYTGDYTVKYEIDRPFQTYGTGTLVGFNPSGEMTTSGKNHTLTFTPTAAGHTELKITVTDDNGSSVSETVNFTTALSPLVVNPQNIELKNEYGNGDIKHKITVTIPDVNPDGKYRFSFTFLDGNGQSETTRGRMYFGIETAEYSRGNQRQLNKGEYTLWYKSDDLNPYEYTHFLKFTIIDPNGVSTSSNVRVALEGN